MIFPFFFIKIFGLSGVFNPDLCQHRIKSALFSDGVMRLVLLVPRPILACLGREGFMSRAEGGIQRVKLQTFQCCNSMIFPVVRLLKHAAWI